jgi:uncharacterized protein YjbI with pentapeptide repeats
MWKNLRKQIIASYELISHQIKENPLGSLLIIFIAIPLIWILSRTVQLGNTGFGNKTLWDWMELLIVPLFLAFGVLLLNASQKKTEQEIEKNRENQTILETYYERMRDLLSKEGLRHSQKDDEARIIARSFTLTALKNLDSKRKGEVIQFLYESKLISGTLPVLNLRGADLSGADLDFLDLRGVVLIDCNLEHVNLKNASLAGANLSGSSLRRANLSGAGLSNVHLTLARCYRANFEGVTLWGAALHRTHFQEANLRGAWLGGEKTLMGDGKGNLIDVSPGADLDETIFYKANLSDAHIGIEQLASSCLNEAKMPDGSRYEKWLSKQSEEFQNVRKKTDRNWKEHMDNSRNKKFGLF